ncbi:MAG: iron-siderophore ABC transporter substrate-binding protein [Roseovarius sp.]
MRACLLPLLCLLIASVPLRAEEAAPQRVVSLSWALTELLIELDAPPVGAADVEGYRQWVAEPAVPDSVADVGLRNEPNFERIAALAPDLILASDQQADLVPLLERIAPVFHVESFDSGQDNAAVSRQTFLQLADRLGRREAALARLDQLDARIRAAGERVDDHFGENVPFVLPIRLLTPTTLRLLGENSMAKAALDAMGLVHPAPGEATDWGFVQRRVEELATFEDVIVLQIGPFAQKHALEETSMWRFMPFVQEGRFAQTRRVWTFGGVFSLGYLADAFAEALLEIEPEDGQ